ncbi:DUF3168 domain-containing protein [Microvirga flavescens]|uniref:DUF3168 domain-containing protein n=1 Tax=Microvirga flavescens TaxID=2249811 RepID=UPI000DDA672B|nr:DUF3168 domain-containing protein [Microvirga flavescens]
MMSPILALRRAILDVAESDAELSALMGGALRLFDETPRDASPVYAVFGDVKATDWSTGSDHGYEQNLSLVVWSQEGSARSGLSVAERFADILHDAPLTLEGHRLVNLRVTEIASERDKDSRLIRVIVRLRAVTETA